MTFAVSRAHQNIPRLHALTLLCKRPRIWTHFVSYTSNSFLLCTMDIRNVWKLEEFVYDRRLDDIYCLKLDLYDKKNPTNKLKIRICLKSVYSIWFVTLQSFWLWIFTCKDASQQANIVGIKTVSHSGLKAATFGLQTFRFPNWATSADR